MAYTNVWDDSAPLDTQAASQGAADFRQTKLDIMQRVASFGAGLLADRPTPEVTSGTADWTGVMYWATDTSQTFMWNGSAWVNITGVATGVIKASNTVEVDTTNPTTGATFNLCSLPANSLSIGSVLTISGYAIAQCNSGSGSVNLQLGTTTGGFATAIFVDLPNDSENYQINYRLKAVVLASGNIEVLSVADRGFFSSPTPTPANVFFGGAAIYSATVADVVSAQFIVGGYTGSLSTLWTIIELNR